MVIVLGLAQSDKNGREQSRKLSNHFYFYSETKKPAGKSKSEIRDVGNETF